MMRFFATHRKFVAAAVGIGCILVNRLYGVELSGIEPQLIDVVLGLGTLFFVERLPNERSRGDGGDPPEGDVL